MRDANWRGLFARVAGVLLLLLFVGCTSPRYQTARKNTPPPLLYNLPSTVPPIEALLHTVIIYRGPGAWKRNAYWDEYVISIVNRGTDQLVVTKVNLEDASVSRIVGPGDDPWALEADSRSALEAGIATVGDVAVQVGGGTLVTGAGAAISYLSVGGATVGSAAGGVLALPAFIGGSIYTNLSSRKAIMREFQSRRLDLPLVLVPGEMAQGSFFFPVFPAPARLVLHGTYRGEDRVFIIDLAPLQGLHLHLE